MFIFVQELDWTVENDKRKENEIYIYVSYHFQKATT